MYKELPKKRFPADGITVVVGVCAIQITFDRRLDDEVAVDWIVPFGKTRLDWMFNDEVLSVEKFVFVKLFV